MEKKEYRYEINGKVYIQRPLVLGQIQQLSEILARLELPFTASMINWLGMLGSKLTNILAIILTPEGTALKDKNVAQLAQEIETWPPDIGVKVIEDFFDCNQISSVLGGLDKTVQNLLAKLQKELKTLSVSSQEATSQNGNTSSGTTPLKNASHI